MKYAFNDFVFDSEQLILYKNSEVVACRNNEAKLLALFLSEPQRVFSKEDILEQVWSGKVVSEQAVFQNISLLRALFGESAIKTFSKKGYQWRIDVEPYVETYVEPQFETATTQPATPVNSRFRQSFVISIALVLIMLSVGGFLYWRSIQVDPQLARIALLPLLVEQDDRDNHNLHAEVVQPVWQAISRTRVFHPVVVGDIKDYDDFFYMPQKYFAPLSGQTRSDVVMVARVGMHKGKVRINYILKSEKGMWSAGHEAETVPLLLEKINAHIALILQSKILDVDSLDSALINAKLKILHQQAPNDFTVWSQLARSEMQNGHSNNAILLADEMAKSARLQGDKIWEAWSYVTVADAYIAQGLYENAELRLQKAVAIFQEEKDYSLLASMQYSYASWAFAKHDYPLFKQSMLTAMQFAKKAQDPLSEVSFSNFLSVIANKYGEKIDRQTYLDHAELILDQTGQSKEHYGSIYFYAGMYAETEALAEKNYRKVLAVLPADQNWWERGRAQEHLTEILMEQSRWQEALDLFSTTEPLKASEELMVTKIYAAQKAWGQAETHGVNTFKVANLTGQGSLALDVALVLVDIHQATQHPEKAHTYKQFIVKEAENVPHWIKFNQRDLEKLGIAMEQ